MWEGEDELHFAPGESLFRTSADENPQTEEERQQAAELVAAIASAQKKLKELRVKEEEQSEAIKALRSELYRTRDRGEEESAGAVVDIGILIDSEDNMNWLKRRAQDLADSLFSLKKEHISIRVGVVYYSQRSSPSDCKVLQFTEDFHKLTQELPPAPRDPNTLSQQRTGLRGALGEAINLLQWQGTARLLLHPSPSSSLRKGQDPPTSQAPHFFQRFGGNSETNVELQRAVLSLRALYIDYFIVKTGVKVEQQFSSPRPKKNDGKFSVAISQYFDDPESFSECRSFKLEEAHNIKRAILSCIGMAMRT